MAEHTIRFLGNLQRLEPRPGDKFVVVTEDRLSPEAVERIQAMRRDFTGHDSKLLVLQGGMRLGVVAVDKA